MKSLLFTIACVTAVASGVRAQNPSEPALVSVNGEHTIKVAPDEAEVSFMVSTKLKDPREAQRTNEAIVAKALAYLKEQGLPSNEVRTTRISLYPYTEYVNDKERRNLYMAQQSVTFKLTDLDKLAGILSGLVGQGVNNIQNVEFKVSNIKELRAEARVKAVQNARSKAESLAEALGQKIGKAYQITDNSSDNGGPQPYMYRGVALEAKTADASASIAPGEISVEAQVHARFYLD